MNGLNSDGVATDVASSEIRHAPTVSCPHCAETILAEAKICRFCQREIDARPPGNIGRTVGIVAAVFVGLVAAFLIYGATLTHGTHTRLYAANQLYGAKITSDQSDLLVDKIAQTVRTDTGGAVDLSHSDAENIAIAFSRGKIDPTLWTKAASFSVWMVRYKSSEFPSPNMADNIGQASERLSSAFAEPETGTESLAPFGLLNATQTQKITQLAAGGDKEGAQKELATALEDFGK